eukprot:TRINITY_DN15289_c0_g1_i2.p1 TRINITY_DN15289_c0_g1~~TRINITY_DN15289_c0_g1_i2.p1  ORF type:complete len:178 (-),score=39.10 TRINITY_DN15289_c0_g1_i2:19-552(-)
MTTGMLSSSCLLVMADLQEYPYAGYAVILAICVFVVSFAMSWGPICWLYPAEIFPMKVKVKALSISTLANWVMNVVVADSVPIMLKALSAPGLFFVFGLCGLGCFGFVFLFVPETKGKSLEEIDRMWTGQAQGLSPRFGKGAEDGTCMQMEHSSMDGRATSAVNWIGSWDNNNVIVM